MVGHTRSWACNQATPRKLPPWLIARLWLNKHLLGGYLSICVAVAASFYLLLSDQIPSDWLLNFDSQIAQGSLTNVRRLTKARSRNQPPSHYFEYSYSFQLPDGRTQTGKSRSNNNIFSTFARPGAAFAVPVSVEYFRKLPNKNRILGTKIGDTEVFTFLCLILPVVGIFLLVRGILQARADSHVLRKGTIAEAIVTHCSRANKSTHFAEISLGGFTLRPSWTRTKVDPNEIPLALFQSKAFERHRSQFDAQGRYQGTPQIRRMLILFVAIMGATVGGFIGFVLALLGPGLNTWLILAGLACGMLVGMAVEWRWQILLRSNSTIKLDDPPSEFKDALCVFQLQQLPPKISDAPIRFRRTLSLKGDASDAIPHPLLHLESPKAITKLVNELEGLSSSREKECLVVHVQDFEMGMLAVMGGVVAIAIGVVLGLN